MARVWTPEQRDVARAHGQIGGRSRSPAKLEACRRNAQARRMHRWMVERHRTHELPGALDLLVTAGAKFEVEPLEPGMWAVRYLIPR